MRFSVYLRCLASFGSVSLFNWVRVGWRGLCRANAVLQWNPMNECRTANTITTHSHIRTAQQAKKTQQAESQTIISELAMNFPIIIRVM